jgi:hypothetical protein
MLCTSSAQLSLKHADPHLPQTELAASRGLQVFLRSDGDYLNGMFPAMYFDRCFIAFVNDLTVIVAVAETGLRPL